LFLVNPLGGCGTDVLCDSGGVELVETGDSYALALDAAHVYWLAFSNDRHCSW